MVQWWYNAIYTRFKSLVFLPRIYTNKKVNILHILETEIMPYYKHRKPVYLRY